MRPTASKADGFFPVLMPGMMLLTEMVTRDTEGSTGKLTSSVSLTGRVVLTRNDVLERVAASSSAAILPDSSLSSTKTWPPVASAMR
jgi:hypothetical protein